MESERQRSMALVTGAAGFLAPDVCAELMRGGTRVRGLIRSGRPPAGVESVGGDLLDRESLRRALRGVRTVVHLAARVHRPPRRSAGTEELALFRRDNVEGTRNLIEEAVAAGVRSFLHISSVKAVATATERPLTEAYAPAPQDPYGMSKLESEVVVREYASAHALHAPILRLPLAYGPGVRANMLGLFRAVDRGLPLPFGGISNRRSLLYAGNLAAAVGAVLRNHLPGAEVFFVSDGEDVSTPELLRMVATALRRPLRLLPFPASAMRVAARAGDSLARIAPMPIRSDMLLRLTGSLQVDIGKIRSLVGYAPRFTVAEGLAHTADWYRREYA